MKQSIEKRDPSVLIDYLALAITTFGVGYLPVAPGTFGSIVGVVIYLLFAWAEAGILIHLGQLGWRFEQVEAFLNAGNLVLFFLFCLIGIWAAGRSTELLGNTDPPQAVVDEVIGQLITFLFVPFGIAPYLVLCGFLLFRLFDIWKPYPIDDLQDLPAGIGICADDLLAGIYAGVCLTVIYAITLTI